jgi:hypothetical protein
VRVWLTTAGGRLHPVASAARSLPLHLFRFMIEHFRPSDRFTASTRLAVWLHQLDSAFGFRQSWAFPLAQTRGEYPKTFNSGLCTRHALAGTSSNSLGQVPEAEHIFKFKLVRFQLTSALSPMLANQGSHFLNCPILKKWLDNLRLFAAKVVGHLKAGHCWIGVSRGKFYRDVELFKLSQFWHNFTSTHSERGVSLSIHLASLRQIAAIRTLESTNSVLLDLAALPEFRYLTAAGRPDPKGARE